MTPVTPLEFSTPARCAHTVALRRWIAARGSQEAPARAILEAARQELAAERAVEDADPSTGGKAAGEQWWEWRREQDLIQDRRRRAAGSS